MKVGKKQIIRIEAVLTPDYAANKNIIQPFVRRHIIFKPSIGESRLHLFDATVKNRIFIFEQTSKCVLHSTFSSLRFLLIRGKPLIAAFNGLVKLPVPPEQLHSLCQFLTVTVPGKPPYLINHVRAGQVYAQPFEHGHIQATVRLLQSGIRNVCFHPVRQIPFVAYGEEHAPLLPDTDHVGTLDVPQPLVVMEAVHITEKVLFQFGNIRALSVCP